MMTAKQVDDKLLRSVQTLKTICRIVGGFEGRKDVLYLSDGLAASPGEELFRLVDLLFRKREALLEIHTFNRVGLFSELANHAVAADVTLHTIDARGLINELTTNAEHRREQPIGIGHVKAVNYQQPLQFLAEQTGGIAIVNSNEFVKGLQRIRNAMTTYYSLGFPLGQSTIDRLHSIEIKLSNLEKSKALYRRQFLERSAKSLTGDRTMAGLLFDPPDNLLGLEVIVGEPEHKKNKVWAVQVTAELPMKNLLMPEAEDRAIAELSLFAVASTDEGRTTLQHNQYPVAVHENRGKVLTFEINFELEAGQHRVSIGLLHEDTGMDGFAVAQVDLPE
jgi:hypothetical protein